MHVAIIKPELRLLTSSAVSGRARMTPNRVSRESAPSALLAKVAEAVGRFGLVDLVAALFFLLRRLVMVIRITFGEGIGRYSGAGRALLPTSTLLWRGQPREQNITRSVGARMTTSGANASTTLRTKPHCSWCIQIYRLACRPK